MSAGIDKSWTALGSHQTAEADRCVDVSARPDRTFGFEEFRKDPEDMGAWTPIGSFSGATYRTADEAGGAARATVPWLDEVFRDA
jgi:hypothetical protein